LLAKIEGLPDQLQTAWQLGGGLPLPKKTRIERVVIAGMGGSAIGADLLASTVSASCQVPVYVHRDYGLPGWARGPETLWIGSSHSGNTEEILDSLEAAVRNRCRTMALCTGGELARRAVQYDVPLWQFEHSGPPRAAVGFSFGLLLAAFARLKLIPPPEKEVAETITSLRTLLQELRPEVSSAQNPSKRLTGELIGRWVNVFAAGPLSSVARRWKTQINELAKAGASFEVLPEADHNTLAGTLHPSEAKTHMVAIFLRAPSDHPRNRLRLALTQQGFAEKGLATQSYEAQGDSALAHLWTTLLFGDFTAYYLAMAYEVDPTPVAALEELKAEMKARP
jgi:glucose/mannose-6-phosphate isomerase